MSAVPGASEGFRSIGQLASDLGVKPHILRYWEEQFPMLRPLKRAGGRRHYRAEDVTLLRLIHRLVVVEGYTLRGARAAIEADRRSRPAAPLAPPVVTKRMGEASPALPLAELRTLRDRLASALADA